MTDTLLRHLDMLSLIPPLPGKIAARELHARLQSQGYPVDVRSVERDLHKLSAHFALVSDEAKPAGWSWRSNQNPIRFPRMDAGTALTYELVARYLAPTFPRSLLKRLDPEFVQARRVLGEFSGAPLARWSRRIAVLPSGHSLLPPDVRPDVAEIVSDSLLKSLRFDADYRPLEGPEFRRYRFNPLGLVYRDGVLYLVATLWDYDDPRQFALHRFAKATALDAPATVPKRFDFERYVREEKAFDFPVGPDVRLELRVEGWLGRYLEERRLSTDQSITPIRDSQNVRVTATVTDTNQFVWWLRSLGASVEVLKPASLRRRMAEQAALVSKMYKLPPHPHGRRPA